MSKSIKLYNPATGEDLGNSTLHNIDDLKNFIAKARIAQSEWEKTSISYRKKKILKIRSYITQNADEISEVIAKDNGKTLVDALATEVVPAAMAVSYYCKKAKSFLKNKSLGMGNIALINKRSYIHRVPFGVVGIISPWNYPFAIPFSEVIMALLAGNAVILKTATQTQLVGKILEKVIADAELPEGLFQFINLPGKIAGDAFLEEGIDKLFFTGSVPVGKYLMKKASDTLTPVSLELGGNDPMIVCHDADIYRAAKGAVWAGFQNAGQSCGGVERIYVHKDIYNEFLVELKKQTEALKVGNNLDLETDIGCLTTSKQKQTVIDHINDALEKGATIYANSTANVPENSNYLAPAVLTNVNHKMLVMKDETFGPVVGVMPFNTYEEALQLANDSYLGLTGSVWSKNSSRAKSLAEQIKAGAIMINDHLMSHGLAETPWGGFKESSIGRSHGAIGFDEMTQPQVIVNDVMPFVHKNMWWHPFNKSIYNGLTGLIDFLYGKGPGTKFTGMINLLKILPRMFSKKD